jgi:hypothetical protein
MSENRLGYFAGSGSKPDCSPCPKVDGRATLSTDSTAFPYPHELCWRPTMSRTKPILVVLALAILVSCGGPDQQALNNYFKAVKNGDKITMAAVSSVEFPEAVESWRIIEMGPESVAPFRIKELDRTLREAKMDLQYIAEKDYLFLSDNQHLYRRYKVRIERNPDAEFTGELADFHKEFKEIRKKGEEAEKAVEIANREFQREKLVAGISLMGTAVTNDLDGEVATKEALVEVTTPSGEKTYRITLKNYDLVNQKTQAKIRSRWIVTEVQAQ